MDIKIEKFKNENISDVNAIWNEVVKDGMAFPQLELLNVESGIDFFTEQSYTGVAFNCENNEVVGIYILHPNNIGRCGHICNCSYAVKKGFSGNKIGEKLVTHSINKGKELGFTILQFNAVVKSNIKALYLYEKLGFTTLGVIPKGFLNKNNVYEDIIPHYIEL